MKRTFASALSLLLLLSLLTMPASAASTVKKSYFESNGMTVQQTALTEDMPLTFVCYNGSGDWEYRLEQGTFHVDSCTVKSSSTSGYQDVTLQVTVSLYRLYNDTAGIWYNWLTWSGAVFDYYTGIEFNFGALSGDVAQTITTTVEYNGRTYPVTCSKSNTWTNGEWYTERTDANGDLWYKQDTTCVSTMVFTVPTGYQGLVYGVYDRTGAPDRDTQWNAGPSGETYYADPEDNGRYFRFANSTTQSLDRDGLDLYLYIGYDDNSTALPYTVTNQGTEHVTGYYALLSYWPITTYYPPSLIQPEESEHFYGYLLPLEVDLAPGESFEGGCEYVPVGWSTMTHKWIKFDNKAEYDAFFKSATLQKQMDGIYQIADSTAGIQWMKDTFGIKIRSGK